MFFAATTFFASLAGIVALFYVKHLELRSERILTPTLKEVADILRVNERTVFRLIHGQNARGVKLPATKIGTWRISQKALTDFLVSNTNLRVLKRQGNKK